LRPATRRCLQHVAVAMMLTAAVAFALQCIFVATSEAATGDTSHYYLGFAPQGGHDSHVVAHGHADGIIHQHAIDDDDDALANHVKEPGWNMALVICVLPSPDTIAISEVESHRLPSAGPRRLPVADVGGLRRPPRPPSIA
jgi:hypothetical protein